MGYDRQAKKVKTAMVEMNWATNTNKNVVQLSYGNVKRLGVLCESNTQILYSAIAGMSHSPDLYTFG